MNYKQKYKEAIEIAKKELDAFGSQDCDAAKQIFRIFPELKESEDERIRKEIIEYLRTKYEDSNAIRYDYKKWIAWLEKQGEKVIDCPQNHQDVTHPNGCIVLEDFNGGEGFYKLNLDYLDKKQVEEVEELVRMWNTELNLPNNENIRACIGMCLTDADEQRFKDFGTTLKDCLAWLEKQCERPNVWNVEDEHKEKT